MFSDSKTFEVNCPSERNVNKSFNECQVQTDPYKIVHRGFQVGRQKVALCQTLPEEEEDKNAMEKCNDSELSSPKFLAFLKKAEAVLTEHLCKSARSKAFQDTENSFDNPISMKTKYCLRVEEHTEPEFSVTGMSWNCTGAMIGIAYGALDHENWCIHNGFVALWNLSRERVDEKLPDTKLECTGCATSVRFHPTIPSLLAIGTFSGDVLVYNMAKEADNLVATAGCTEGGHTESVNQIEWMTDTAGGLTNTEGDVQRVATAQLITVGGDGRIICWSVNMYRPPAKIKCTKIFQVRNSDQPPLNKPVYISQTGKSCGASMGNTVAYAERSVSLTTGVLSPHQSDQLIVGTDSGGILLCNLSKFAPMQLAEKTTVTRHPSPVEFSLSRQSGPIHAVDWSRYHRNLVLSCGSGTGMRIHSTLQRDLFIDLDPGQGDILTAQFSPTQANIIICASANGTLSIFDLLGGCSATVESNDDAETWNGPTLIHTTTAATATLTESTETSKRSQLMTVLSFNHKDSSILASGDQGGRVWIWTIDRIRSQPVSQLDSSVLDRLFKQSST